MRVRDQAVEASFLCSQPEMHAHTNMDWNTTHLAVNSVSSRQHHHEAIWATGLRCNAYKIPIDVPTTVNLKRIKSAGSPINRLPNGLSSRIVPALEAASVQTTSTVDNNAMIAKDLITTGRIFVWSSDS